jgi:hypothetical protein
LANEAGIVPKNEGHGGSATYQHHEEQYRRRPLGQPLRHTNGERCERVVEGLRDFNTAQLIGHAFPDAAMNHPSFGSTEENSLISIFSKKAGKAARRVRQSKSLQSNPARTSTEFECPLMAHSSGRSNFRKGSIPTSEAIAGSAESSSL